MRKNFAQDLVAITQGPWSGDCIDATVAHAAWHEKPVRTVIAEDDRMIPPALQEQMAKAVNAKVIRVPSSHVVTLSHPEVVADAIVASVNELN